MLDSSAIDTRAGDSTTGPTTRFNDLYGSSYGAILAYCRRRVDPVDAADVTAEVFTVAWRRIDDVPPGPAALWWLYATARRVVSNHHRSHQRRTMLVERLRAQPADVDHGADAASDSAAATRAALATLSAEDQEILRLSAWEELGPTEIAAVLGLRTVSVRSRLLRARRRLAARLSVLPADPEAMLR